MDHFKQSAGAKADITEKNVTVSYFLFVFRFNANSKNETQRYNKVFNLMKDRDDICNQSQRKL